MTSDLEPWATISRLEDRINELEAERNNLRELLSRFRSSNGSSPVLRNEGAVSAGLL